LYEPTGEDLYGDYAQDVERYQWVSTPRIGQTSDRLGGGNTPAPSPSEVELRTTLSLIDEDPDVGAYWTGLSRADKKKMQTTVAQEAKAIQRQLTKTQKRQVSFGEAVNIAYKKIKEAQVKNKEGFFYDNLQFNVTVPPKTTHIQSLIERYTK